MPRSAVRAIMLVLPALAINACSDTSPVEPPTSIRAEVLGAASSARADSPLQSNSVKYRDAGNKPASGRSGSASLEARALLGKDRVTTVEVSTGTLDVPAPPGNISKVQLKTFGLSGSLIESVNSNGLSGGGYWSTRITGVPRGVFMEVQANVRNIDGNRTDVVVASPKVMRRPDLKVTGVTNPATSSPGAAVRISALVKELNGDVGARADCLLLVDGLQVDRALGIWVDAGDAVSCAFVHSFVSTGQHVLMVRASNVVPGDWDLANNSATGAIEIVAPTVRMSWDSYAYSDDEGFEDSGIFIQDSCRSVWYFCTRIEQTFQQSNRNQVGSLSFTAVTSDAAATYPVDLSFSATAAGATVARVDSRFGSDGMQGCINVYDGRATWADICASGTSTSVSVDRYAGVATYFASSYSSRFVGQPIYCYTDGGFYTCGKTISGPYVDSYSYNISLGSNVLDLFSVGTDVTTSMVLTDAAGRRFSAGGSYAVRNTGDYDVTTPYSVSFSNPFFLLDQSGVRREWYHFRSGTGTGQ